MIYRSKPSLENLAARWSLMKHTVEIWDRWKGYKWSFCSWQNSNIFISRIIIKRWMDGLIIFLKLFCIFFPKTLQLYFCKKISYNVLTELRGWPPPPRCKMLTLFLYLLQLREIVDKNRLKCFVTLPLSKF